MRSPAAALPSLIVLSVFAVTVSHYWFLGDDAYISFRYAQNLVAGDGLVFNPGERVEGYTNFLWVLLMAAATAVGLPVEWTANGLGIAAGAGILVLVYRLGALTGSRGPLLWVAPLALAGNRTFAAWSTGGLETQLFSLLVLGGLVRLHAERRDGARAPLGSAALFALAALTRPEGVLFFGVAALFFLADVVARRRAVASLCAWAAVFSAVVACHVAWRQAYYGFPLPNTFYAKVSGGWLEQGSLYLRIFASDYFLALVAPLALVAVVLARSFLTLLFAGVVSTWAAYLLYIGGDRFEYRLLTPVLPYLYLLAQEGIRSVVSWIPASAWRTAAGTALAALVVASSWWPNVSGFRPVAGITRVESIGRYADERGEQGRFLRHLLEAGYLQGSEVLAVTGAGALPYYSGLPTVDIHGLNDVQIAHQPLAKRGIVGHEKFASPEYLVERGVLIYDVFNRLVLPPGKDWQPERRVRKRPSYRGLRRVGLRGDGRVLQFGTRLDEASLRARLPRFEVLPGEPTETRPAPAAARTPPSTG